MAWFMIDPSNDKEIGAIAHGPVLLARVEGVTVGLRSIMAYSAGLEVAVTVVGSGIHAEAMRRQYTAPAVIDPETGKRRPGQVHGRPMRLRALEDSILQPVPRSDNRGWYDSQDLYQREYLYEVTGLPQTRNLPLVAEWPEVGLEPVTTHLVLPDPSELAGAIIPLP
ncbi:hypothetical protein AXA44_42000 [Rhodococcus sp. SC4]|nr:hypothetical protein [Rhodococcus sp. ACPA1]KXF54113.1 hypothetical protein AXA44_42000 [Rhodococcus sp. SC4]PBC45285.1 hypothetical protein CJ177_46485 [Rhodococcus sp. ACPA1]